MKAEAKYLGVLFAFMVGAQAVMCAQTIQARITGGGGSGKCTFEVSVNGSAEVEIRGDRGYLKNISGQPGQWRRLVCNQPLPRNPNNFRFQGVDGRGKQYMVRDPNSNNGTAVIRIEDNRNGFEGYTGDILWDGGGNSAGNGDWNNGNNGGWNNGNNNGGWNNNGNNNSNNNWGNNNSGQWSVVSAYYGSGNRRRDVTGNVRRLVNGPDFQVNNNSMGGDPAVGAQKTLEITARAANGKVQTLRYSEYSTVPTKMFSGGGGGSWGGNNQGNNNSWNQNQARSSCQNAIRSQLVGAYGGTLDFTGNPSQEAAGGGVRVRGTARFRDRSGKSGNIEYKCAVDMNGSVQDARYQVTNSY